MLFCCAKGLKCLRSTKVNKSKVSIPLGANRITSLGHDFCESTITVSSTSLWLFNSHESKVRNLNYHLNCAFWITQCTHERCNCDIWIMQCTHERCNCDIWITQCTHERCNCDIWITQCTHERPNLGFSIPEREKNVWVPCQSNMHGARISCASVHMQRAVYRRKWLEGHLASPPKSQFRGQGIHTVISLRDLRDA